ncbi:MAG: CusA/CzcA family heavy metal efflux RND transporter [Bacteroidaceae bacterium]|nr:CusA/CzcA family heavy metal efflux RND transporter [Bacteroidaceae bacterium]
MINKIILYSIQHKFIVLLLLAVIIGGGLYGMRTVNVDSTPDITDNQVQVITSSPNLGTLDIEQFVTYPVELAMSNLPGVEDIRSVSRFGLSVVTVVFKENMGTYLPRQLVKEKLDEVEEQIPEGFGKPEIGPITTGLGEIYQYTLVPKDVSKYSPQELRTMQDWVVKRQLSMIPGVVDVNSFGGSIKQYEIALSSEQLNSRHVTMQEVFDALSKNNVNTGGAYIEKDHMASFIRGEGLVKSLDDIRHIVVKNESGVPILISDVAEEVRFGHQVRYGAFTQDGHEAVGGMILMLKGANSAKVVAAVKERMKDVQKSLPKDIQIKPFLDRSNLIERTTSTIARNLTEGALIVIFVLVLLLGSVRGGLITASVIPLSLLFAFILMRVFGVSANLMSLGAIDFGIIVDGAVIIVEGIVHKVERAKFKMVESPLDMEQIGYESASTMMGAAFFGQLIILIVFAPILFLTGISGKMFQPMAYTFAFAVLGALILCLTYVPAISVLLLRPHGNKNSRLARFEQRLHSLSENMMAKVQQAYSPLLAYSLAHRRLVLLLAAGLFVISGLVFWRMGGEFIPELDEGDIAMQTFLRPGSSLEETIKREEEVEQVLLQNFPEIKTVCARIGVADIPTDPMGFDYTDSFVILEKDKSKWKNAKTKEELIEKMIEKLDSLPGLNYSFSQPVALRFNELLTGVREDIAVKVYGEDLDTLNMIGEKMVNVISKIDGAEDVALERTAGLPQITVKYDRQRIARYGLNIDKLNSYVCAAFAGAKAGVIFEGEKRFDMVIRLDQKERKSIDDIQNLYVDLPNGSLIPLKEVADISYEPGPMQISRDKASRRVYVGVNVRGRDVQSLVDEIKHKLDKQVKMPTGYHVTYGGEFQNMQDARERMTIVMPIALLLIFVLLYFALKSVKQALMIYIAVPLSTIGGVLALALRGMPFSISAGVGFIVLFGVAVLNGLVLVNRFNALHNSGVGDIRECVIKGTRERLRPILLTATAAMLGFLPMAFSGSAGAEVQRPLATVVIGGLFTATTLTLIVLPILYMYEEKIGNRLMNHHLQVTSVLLALLWLPSVAKAQIITLQQAQEMAIKNYPSMRAAHLNIQSQQALLPSAFNLGDTELSTGGEEIGKGNEATYTLIALRQNLDIFSIGAKKGLLNQQLKVAEAEGKVVERDLMREVGIDYVNALVARHRTKVYESLDSVFSDFEKAAKMRYETEATSKLEYISALQQLRQNGLALRQAQMDEDIANRNMNRWLGTETHFLPADSLELSIETPLLNQVPTIQLASEKVKLAEKQVKAEKAEFLPKLYVQGGSQKIGNNSGYWSYEVGVSMPVFSSERRAKAKAGKLQFEAEKAQQEHTELLLKSELQALSANNEKWHEQLKYYREVVLPLADEQQRVAIMSYHQGAIDYIGFIENMKEAAKVQLDYWDVYGEYLTSHIKLLYF